jgi:hypothetical protein
VRRFPALQRHLVGAVITRDEAVGANGLHRPILVEQTAEKSASKAGRGFKPARNETNTSDV